MAEKYVKDRAHNRYPAYCCDDIDERVGKLEEALADLLETMLPEGTVRLSSLAEDARSWSREINKGRLVAEWIGTRAEYEAHVAENGGEPLANVKYIITDDEHLVGSVVTVFALTSYINAGGETITEAQRYEIGDEVNTLCTNTTDSRYYLVPAGSNVGNGDIKGTFRCVGLCGTCELSDGSGAGDLYLFQRVE